MVFILSQSFWLVLSHFLGVFHLPKQFLLYMFRHWVYFWIHWHWKSVRCAVGCFDICSDFTCKTAIARCWLAQVNLQSTDAWNFPPYLLIERNFRIMSDFPREVEVAALNTGDHQWTYILRQLNRLWNISLKDHSYVEFYSGISNECSKWKLSTIHNVHFSLLDFPRETDLKLMDFVELLKKNELKDSTAKELHQFVTKNLEGYIIHTRALIA